MSVKDKIARAALPERTISICLRGDLDAEHQRLTTEVLKLKATGASSLAGADLGDLPDRIEALRLEIEAESIVVRLRALTRRRWSELIAQHPARPGNERDAKVGLNAFGFYSTAIRESAIDCELDAADWATLLGDADTDGLLTDGQWDQLIRSINELNQSPASVPFSLESFLKTKGSASA